MTNTPNEPVHLRPAREEDLPTLVEILHAAFEEYRGRLDPPSGVHNETAETLQQKLRKGGAVLALLNGEAAGCVFFEQRGPSMYLGRLSVLPHFRRQGVARVLVDYVEQRARERRCSGVELGVRTALPRLIDFYTRLGYRPFQYRSHDGYSEPTYVLMKKDLS